MYEHNALGYWPGLALCLTKVRSSQARCPATALISFVFFCILFLYCHLNHPNALRHMACTLLRFLRNRENQGGHDHR